jgi:hypothetical protein
MMTNLKKLLKESEKEDRKLKGKLTNFDLLTKEEFNDGMKSVKGYMKLYEYLGSNYYKVEKDHLNMYISRDRLLHKIQTLVNDGKIARIK